MRFLLLVSMGLAVLGTASAQISVTKLNGGLEAELLSVGRSVDHHGLTAAMRISNKGKSTAQILMVGGPVVVDNAGSSAGGLNRIGGLAQCNNGAPPTCYGIPRVIEGQTVPLQSFTVIDPDVSITVTMLFNYGNSSGPRLSFSAELAYRLIADTGRDATLPDADKYKQFRVMSLSFASVPVTDAK